MFGRGMFRKVTHGFWGFTHELAVLTHRKAHVTHGNRSLTHRFGYVTHRTTHFHFLPAKNTAAQRSVHSIHSFKIHFDIFLEAVPLHCILRFPHYKEE